MAADPKLAHIARDLEAEAPLMACCFDPTGKYVFASAENRTIYRWNLADGKRTALAAHDSWIGDLAVSADGKTLISAGYDDQLIWWPADAEAPQPANKIKAHAGWIRSIALSPDGALLVSGGNDRFVRIWNARDGTKIRELPGHELDVYSVAFHPNGQWIVSGDLLGQIRQWESATGKMLRTFDAKALHTYEGGQQVHYGGVRALTFSPDAKWLAGGGLHKASNPLGNVQEPLALRFEWESAKMVRNHLTDATPNERLWGLQFHPQAFLIGCLGGNKGQVVFWNEGEEKPFHVHNLPSSARGMALHPDGLQIATTHHDRKLRISKLAAKA
jgi:WD40 repeat protein